MLLNGSFALGASGGKRERNKLNQNCKDLLKLHKVCLALSLLYETLGEKKKICGNSTPDLLHNNSQLIKSTFETCNENTENLA